MKRATTSTDALLRKISNVDPLGGHPSLTADQLRAARDHVTAIQETPDRPSTFLTLPTGTSAGADSRTRWARPLLVAAIIVPVVALIGATLYFRPPGERGTSVPTSGLAATSGIPAQYQQIAARYAPLTQHLTVGCGGQSLPIALLAAPGGAENSTGPAAEALRNLFHDNPFAGMGTVTPKNWVLLAQSGTRAIFGQRIGPIGVGTVLVFTRHGDHFAPTSETGCSTVRTGPTTTAEPITAAAGTATGTTLSLQWQASSNCGTGPARTSRVVDRVAILETATTVRVLLISRPATDAGAGATHGACGATSLTATATAHLKAPLGQRHILDDARVPSTPITVTR